MLSARLLAVAYVPRVKANLPSQLGGYAERTGIVIGEVCQLFPRIWRTY